MGRPSDVSAAAVLEALEAWKTQAAEKAARTESKILWSLLTLESRISQSLEQSAEAHRRIGESSLSERTTSQEWKDQVAEVFAPTQSKLLSGLDAVTRLVWESESTVMAGLEALEKKISESGSNAWSVLEALDKPSWEPESKVLSSLEALEKRIWESEAKLLSTIEALEKRIGEPESRLLTALEALETRSGEPESRVLAALEALEKGSGEPESRVLAALEALEKRIGESQQQTEEARSFLAGQIALAREEADETRRDLLLISESLHAGNTLVQRLEDFAVRAQKARNTQIELLSQLVDLQENLGSRMGALEARVKANSRNQEADLAKLRESMELLETKASRDQDDLSERVVEVLSQVSVLLEELKLQNRLTSAQPDERVLRALEGSEEGPNPERHFLSSIWQSRG